MPCVGPGRGGGHHPARGPGRGGRDLTLLAGNAGCARGRAPPRPTVWSRWGVPQAINTGDFLYVTSHLACHRLIAAGTSVKTAHAAQHELDDASLQLTLGQHLDMAFEQRPIVPAEEYLRMIAGKTASLLAAAAAVGALGAGGSPEGRGAP